MRTNEQFKLDAATIDEIMKRYTGTDGAHFGFVAQADGKRQFFIGGRVDIGGLCVAEALANVVEMTPGLDETYIDMICETAHEFLKEPKQ